MKGDEAFPALGNQSGDDGEFDSEPEDEHAADGEEAGETKAAE